MLPIETNAESPSPRASARSRIARPSAPLCDEKPILPGGNARGAKVAFSPEAVDGDPEAVGSDQASAVGADEREQLVLSLDPFDAGLREPRRDDAERADAVLERLLRGVEDMCRREGR